jgi:hypothetical protein
MCSVYTFMCFFYICIVLFLFLMCLCFFTICILFVMYWYVSLWMSMFVMYWYVCLWIGRGLGFLILGCRPIGIVGLVL